MTQEQYLKNIQTIVNDFTEQFECTAIRGAEFQYFPFVDFIEYELRFGIVDRADRDFITSVKRLKPKARLNPFVWALLHEIGHHETYYDLTEEEDKWCDRKKKRIARTRATKPYYNMPDEVLATTWAVNYANTHAAELAEFWEKLNAEVEGLFTFLRKG